MMLRRAVSLVSLLLLAAPAWADPPAVVFESHTSPTPAAGDSSNRNATTAFVNGSFIGVGGDCTVTYVGNLPIFTCTKLNGVSPGSMFPQNVTAGGDLSGSWPSVTVAKVQGLPWKAGATYTDKQTPIWNAANGQFEPGNSSSYLNSALATPGGAL